MTAMADLRVQQLETLFRTQLSQIYDNLQGVCDKLFTDEVLVALKGDPASAAHYHWRVREIVEDGLMAEKERSRQQLLHQLADRETEVAMLRKETMALAAGAGGAAGALASTVHALSSSPPSSGPANVANLVRLQEEVAVLRRTAHQEGDNRQKAEAELQRNFMELQSLREELAVAKRETQLQASECSEFKRQLHNCQNDAVGSKQLAYSSQGELVDIKASLESQQRHLEGVTMTAQQASERVRLSEEMLAKSERERLDLRAKYLTVSEKFEQLMQSEGDTVASLNAKIRALKVRLGDESKESDILRNALDIAKVERDTLKV